VIGGIVVALLALVVVLVVSWPLVRGDGGGDPVEDDPRRRELDAQIDRALRSIREIEFDHRSGNLSDEDFAELDRAERANAARLLRRRDALDAEGGAPTTV